MNENLKKLFENVVNDTPFPIPLRYYGNLQSLAGLVYDPNDDSDMEKELAELSKYVQKLVFLNEFEDIVKRLVPEQMDFRHMFDTGLDYRHQNLNQATVNFPQTINFPEQNYQVSESLIKSVVQNYKETEFFDFNVSKIISWIRNKINT